MMKREFVNLIKCNDYYRTKFIITNSAKAAGITVMNEIGVDPGVDHLYALKTINEVHALGGKVCKFIH
jgi:saccharopine dehydrogenase-like NADP-dependent oxidoreductase